MDGFWFYGAFFLLVGVRGIHKGLCYRRSRLKARDWPTSTGTVIKSDAKRSATGVWMAEIEYSYRVDSAEYRSSVVNVDGELNVGFSDRYARRRVERYPVGAGVVVHYKPDQPEYAFLETRSSPASTLRFSLGLALLLAGATMIMVPFF